MKISTSLLSTLLILFTLISDTALAQRDGRSGTRGDRERRVSRVEPRGQARSQDRRLDRSIVNYDRWNRPSGYRFNNRWHYSNRIEIRAPYRWVRYDRNLNWIHYFDEQVRNYGSTFLGMTRLENTSLDFDTIYTGGCGYRDVQIRVVGNDANIDHLVVLMSNGEQDYIDVNTHFHANTWSQWIDVQGGARCISGVVVVGKSAYWGQQAQIEIYGHR